MLRSERFTEQCGIGQVKQSNCVADAAQRNLVIEDDLFRQGPAPGFSSLHAVITMLFHASLNIHAATLWIRIINIFIFFRSVGHSFAMSPMN
jgi:hypothetical protein